MLFKPFPSPLPTTIKVFRPREALLNGNPWFSGLPSTLDKRAIPKLLVRSSVFLSMTCPSVEHGAHWHDFSTHELNWMMFSSEENKAFGKREMSVSGDLFIWKSYFSKNSLIPHWGQGNFVKGTIKLAISVTQPNEGPLTGTQYSPSVDPGLW